MGGACCRESRLARVDRALIMHQGRAQRLSVRARRRTSLRARSNFSSSGSAWPPRSAGMQNLAGAVVLNSSGKSSMPPRALMSPKLSVIFTVVSMALLSLVKEMECRPAGAQ